MIENAAHIVFLMRHNSLAIKNYLLHAMLQSMWICEPGEPVVEVTADIKKRRKAREKLGKKECEEEKKSPLTNMISLRGSGKGSRKSPFLLSGRK